MSNYYVLWCLSIFYFTNLTSSYVLMTSWHPYSWKSKKVHQPVNYKNIDLLNENENKLKKVFPLIYAGEADKLKQEISKAQKGEAIVLMGGDCAETFDDHDVSHYVSNFRILLQMTLILMNNVGLPIIKIGRMAGQYAKPRSDLYEIKNDIMLPSYRGDIINEYKFDNQREYDSNKMVEAYYKSVQTMNLIRALSQGGYADIKRIKEFF